MTKYTEIKETHKLSDDELNIIEKLTDDLVIWMFNKPNDRYPIVNIIQKAYLMGRNSK